MLIHHARVPLESVEDQPHDPSKPAVVDGFGRPKSPLVSGRPRPLKHFFCWWLLGTIMNDDYR